MSETFSHSKQSLVPTLTVNSNPSAMQPSATTGKKQDKVSSAAYAALMQQMKAILLQNMEIKMQADELKNDISGIEQKVQDELSEQLKTLGNRIEHVNKKLKDRLTKESVEVLIANTIQEFKKSLDADFASKQELDERLKQVERNVSEKIQLTKLVEDLAKSLSEQRDMHEQQDKEQQRKWDKELATLREQNDRMQREMDKLTEVLEQQGKNGGVFSKLFSCFGCFGQRTLK